MNTGYNLTSSSILLYILYASPVMNIVTPSRSDDMSAQFHFHMALPVNVGEATHFTSHHVC